MANDIDTLTTHLTTATGLPTGQARRLIDDVLAYFDETVDAFITRRHRELMAQGLKNDAIYRQLGYELHGRRFLAAPLTERQIRRLIYG